MYDYMNFLREAFRKLSSDRQTYRQTRLKLYHAARRMVKNHSTYSSVFSTFRKLSESFGKEGQQLGVKKMS